ncbi:HlyD family efflux transporter periplasmic adaptor subunit [Halovulum dunhuangense]|uniref:HlyD family efflux transporter periplasmic adaptor subunit n=1 Tax=Halovulum dunhuangense TaxID=1505036 RepID=A0A849L892_9RHOB|nr:HlyD family efflux transporter periplasmic adaptor subunit [Halovulum dunhuangense]
MVVIALWVIIGEQITGVTADATVNARLVTVRAPIAGDLEFPTRALGGSVVRNEVLGSVEDRRVDAVRLDDLAMEVALTEAAVARHTALQDETNAIIEALGKRAQTYRARRIDEIETRLAYARERLALLENGVFPAGFDIAPPQDAGVERAAEPAADGLQALWINAVSERIAVLENELESTRAGAFLGDGYNDAPNSEQRIAELQTERAAHAAAIAEAEARRDAYADRLDAERLRVNRAREAELVSPVSGRLWQVVNSNGTNVQRGDPVARLLDCGSVIVTASVTESVYNSLTIGGEATFRPMGDRRDFEATVIRLAGAGAATIYANLAVAPSERHLQRFDVALSVPGLAADPELTCAVGRTGRAFFDRRPLDWIRGLWG